MMAHLGLDGLALKRTVGVGHAEMASVGVVGSVLEYCDRVSGGGSSDQCSCSNGSSSLGVDDLCDASICSDGDEEFDGMEAGSVACIYTQLVCVTVVVIWLTISAA